VICFFLFFAFFLLALCFFFLFCVCIIGLLLPHGIPFGRTTRYLYEFFIRFIVVIPDDDLRKGSKHVVFCIATMIFVIFR
jgi:hypothetical protein